MLVATVEATDRKYGTHEYEIRMIHEFGARSKEFASRSAFEKKLLDMYVESMQHDVLFSDFTRGNFNAFVTLFLDPRSVWFELTRVADLKIIGAGYLTDVILNYDADAHFTVWDSIGAGREPVFIELMRFVTSRYNLRRLSASIPVYQRGTIRMTKRLGFEEEGKKRAAILHKNGEWVPSIMFGILWEDLHNERWRKDRNTGGNERFNGRGRFSTRGVVHEPTNG